MEVAGLPLRLGSEREEGPVILWLGPIHLIFTGDEFGMPSMVEVRAELRRRGALYDSQGVPRPRHYKIFTLDHSKQIDFGVY